jgi:hypothetical protein
LYKISNSDAKYLPGQAIINYRADETLSKDFDDNEILSTSGDEDELDFGECLTLSLTKKIRGCSSLEQNILSCLEIFFGLYNVLLYFCVRFY